MLSDTDEPIAATFESELEALINRYSQEHASNTPDFILAQYLVGCLRVWNAAVTRREEWSGRSGTAPATMAQAEMLTQSPAPDDPTPAKGFADGLDERAGDPRVDRIEAGFKAIHAATNGEYSREDMIVMDALQAGRDFVIRLARRECHIEQLVAELKARERIIELYERQLSAPARRPAP